MTSAQVSELSLQISILDAELAVRPDQHSILLSEFRIVRRQTRYLMLEYSDSFPRTIEVAKMCAVVQRVVFGHWSQPKGLRGANGREQGHMLYRVNMFCYDSFISQSGLAPTPV